LLNYSPYFFTPKKVIPWFTHRTQINSLWDKFYVIAFSRTIDSFFKYTFYCLPFPVGRLDPCPTLSFRREYFGTVLTWILNIQ
ncbi:MAG: hypothetical protein ABIR66_05265, partial [Saprospiraceae bacterium]